MANAKMSEPPIGNSEFLPIFNVLFIFFIKRLIKKAVMIIIAASFGMKYRSLNKLKSEQMERIQNKSGVANHSRLVTIRIAGSDDMAVVLQDLVLAMQKTITIGTIKLSKSIESL